MEEGTIELLQPLPDVEALERLWKACVRVDGYKPDYIYIAPKQFKIMSRYFRSKRKGHHKWTRVSRTLVLELRIPSGSYEPFNWWDDTVKIDKRCLKRYRRRARK